MCAVDCWRHVLQRCGSAAVAAPMGARVWREVRQWERGRERVSVCLFVTLCHLSKYSCIIVRCESLRVWVSSSLLLLRFSKTVTGPLGRHTSTVPLRPGCYAKKYKNGSKVHKTQRISSKTDRKAPLRVAHVISTFQRCDTAGKLFQRILSIR